MSHPVSSVLLVISLCPIVLIGCGSSEVTYTEVKRIDEPLTRADVELVLRVIQRLPGGNLPPMPTVYVSPPDWDPTRSLSIKELTTNEAERVRVGWEVGRIADAWENDRDLRAALQQEQITLEQFAGLVLSVGSTLSRSETQNSDNLAEVIERADQHLPDLWDDHRPFSSLSPSEQYQILIEATWLTRRERAKRLGTVPETNIAVIEPFRAELIAVLPAEFAIDPLDAIADRQAEEGVPFETLPGSARDDELTWDPDEALVGTDPDR